MLSGSPLALIPIGQVPQDLLHWLAEELAREGWEVKLAPPIPIPVAAFDPRRQQLRGDALLDALRHAHLPGGRRVLGIVDADCYAPGLNFIFGQAALGGRQAFIALPRLRPSTYGLPMQEGLFRARVLKEAQHELGHTLGLPHCPDPLCVMHFSNSLTDTDRKGARYCARCRALLERLTEREDGC